MAYSNIKSTVQLKLCILRDFTKALYRFIVEKIDYFRYRKLRTHFTERVNYLSKHPNSGLVYMDKSMVEATTNKPDLTENEFTRIIQEVREIRRTTPKCD